MSKKNIKRHGRQTRFEEELSSLDDVPSTDTSLNGAAAGIESVGMKETAETSGAEIGEVRKTKKELQRHRRAAHTLRKQSAETAVHQAGKRSGRQTQAMSCINRQAVVSHRPNSSWNRREENSAGTGRKAGRHVRLSEES